MNVTKTNLEILTQKSESIHQHLLELYQTVNILPWIPTDLVVKALQELYTASKIFQTAASEIYQNEQKILERYNLLEIQFQQYQELFEYAPIAYLITDEQGIITAANQTASTLFNIPQQSLIGKQIINFIAFEQRENFYHQILKISKNNHEVREIVLPIQPFNDDHFEALLTVKNRINQQDHSKILQWSIQRIYPHQSPEITPIQNLTDLENTLQVHKYAKGENIPLHPHLIWYVSQGLVKLSTFSETGEEIITGLVAPKMVFGSTMTSLQIYEATALVNVDLLSISETQLNYSPALKKLILPKIQQHLKQAEYFLFIAGQRKLETRLLYLLEVLKQRIGEPVAEGTRLRFHLTHQDMANICGTTRVTITRLLGQFQEQGLIMIDNKRHIICK